jgi:heme O synthase-like polyprenyltransferase
MNEYKQKIIYTGAMLVIFLIIANTMVEVNWFLQIVAVIFAGYYILYSVKSLRDEQKDKN